MHFIRPFGLFLERHRIIIATVYMNNTRASEYRTAIYRYHSSYDSDETRTSKYLNLKIFHEKHKSVHIPWNAKNPLIDMTSNGGIAHYCYSRIYPKPATTTAAILHTKTQKMPTNIFHGMQTIQGLRSDGELYIVTAESTRSNNCYSLITHYDCCVVCELTTAAVHDTPVRSITARFSSWRAKTKQEARGRTESRASLSPYYYYIAILVSWCHFRFLKGPSKRTKAKNYKYHTHRVRTEKGKRLIAQEISNAVSKVGTTPIRNIKNTKYAKTKWNHRPRCARTGTNTWANGDFSELLLVTTFDKSVWSLMTRRGSLLWRLAIRQKRTQAAGKYDTTCGLRGMHVISINATSLAHHLTHARVRTYGCGLR